MNLGAVSEVDALAMTMVLILVLSFGVIALLIWSITRHSKRRDREVEDLLDEVRRDEKVDKLPTPPAGSAPPENRELWEKDGDWWKK